MIFKEGFHKIKFTCRKCGKCCRESRIRLSPYDLLKLCAHLSLSTDKFHRKYTYFMLDEENKNMLTCMLKTSPECPFLKAGECSLYQERPFGCRTYPLGLQPIFNGVWAEHKYYLLEECPGTGSGRKITIDEFRQEEGIIQLEELHKVWVVFKVKVLNTKLSSSEEYNNLFFNVCYNFDGIEFKKLLVKNGLSMPTGIDEKYDLILRLANKLLL